MTYSLLARAASLLFGLRWQNQLAAELGVSDRTVRYWVAGKPIPPGVAGDLIAALDLRMMEIEEVQDELRAAAPR